MEKIGMKLRSKKEQRIAAELGDIIDRMVNAMWTANKEAIAEGLPLTPRMSDALALFQDHCARHYGKKA
jgi:hypothetical protein